MAIYPFDASDMRFPIKAYIDQAIAESGGGAGAAVIVMIAGGDGITPPSVFGGSGVASVTRYAQGVVGVTLDTPRALGAYVAVATVTSPTITDWWAVHVEDVSDAEKYVRTFQNGTPADADFMFVLWHVTPAP